MATRYIGDARVSVRYDGYRSPHMQYSGRVSVPAASGRSRTWSFDGIGISEHTHTGAADSAEAFDKAAAAAVGFGSYFTSDNRGDDVPAWAPSEDVADAISEATGWATDEEGRGLFAVRRSKDGPVHWTS